MYYLNRSILVVLGLCGSILSLMLLVDTCTVETQDQVTVTLQQVTEQVRSATCQLLPKLETMYAEKPTITDAIAVCKGWIEHIVQYWKTETMSVSVFRIIEPWKENLANAHIWGC